MCGISGVVYRDPRRQPDPAVLRRMNDTLHHRGPDAGAEQVLGPVGLAHRRLSILDLSAAGTQPMRNEDGSVWIVFNGEVYNHRALRAQLTEPHTFQSATDTEVLLHLYEERGPAMVDLLDGMFALCIYDQRRQQIVLARDPFGIKPLYYALDDERLLFGSELKALRAGGLPDALDPDALCDFFDFDWIPAPRTIYRAARKLPPAHVAVLDLATWRWDMRCYWQATYAPREGRHLNAWVDDLHHTLTASVQARLVADVPLGVFLSGGIDSSLVAGLATERGPVDAYTIGFEDAAFSEAERAQQTATHLGIDLTVHRVDALASLDTMAHFYDEPFADSSLLPTSALCRATRAHKTVALSGDGADELFGGYWHHGLAARSAGWDRWLRGPLPPLFQQASRGLPSDSRLHEWARRFGQSPTDRRLSLARLPGRARALDVVARNHRGGDRFWHLRAHADRLQGLPPTIQAQLYDLALYLPSDMLVKVDRASMAHSLEVRVPFLSRAVADLAFSMPAALHHDGAHSKRVPRALAGRLVDTPLAAAPKQGFAVPLERWMAAEASPAHERRLLDSGAVRAGWLSAAGVHRAFERVRTPRKGRYGGAQAVFRLMVFDAWWRAHHAAA